MFGLLLRDHVDTSSGGMNGPANAMAKPKAKDVSQTEIEKSSLLPLFYSEMNNQTLASLRVSRVRGELKYTAHQMLSFLSTLLWVTRCLTLYVNAVSVCFSLVAVCVFTRSTHLNLCVKGLSFASGKGLPFTVYRLI